MDVMYTIIKVYVTERYDVIKRHNNVITIWRTSAVELTAVLKNQCLEMRGVQEKESIIGLRVDRKVRQDF